MLQVLLGDVGAGKSSLVLRFVKGQFIEFQVGLMLQTFVFKSLIYETRRFLLIRGA